MTSPEFKVFKSVRFGNIKAALIDGKPVFGLADICRALKVRKDAHLTMDGNVPYMTKSGYMSRERGNGQIVEVPLALNIVGIKGVKRLMELSDREDLEEFQNWICEGVILGLYDTQGEKVFLFGKRGQPIAKITILDPEYDVVKSYDKFADDFLITIAPAEREDITDFPCVNRELDDLF